VVWTGILNSSGYFEGSTFHSKETHKDVGTQLSGSLPQLTNMLYMPMLNQNNLQLRGDCKSWLEVHDPALSEGVVRWTGGSHCVILKV